MDFLPQAFKAHATPSLNEKPAHSAYIFGAASPLGEALLNQLLASRLYTQVFVATQAPLPATIAHLQGVSMDAFALQCGAKRIDLFLIAQNLDPITQLASMPHIGTRQQVYRPLPSAELSATLAKVSGAIGATQFDAIRWCLVAPDTETGQAAALLAPYSAGAKQLVYGLGVSDRPARESTAFKAQGDHFLDRLGAGLLNLIARIAGQIVNPKAAAPLSRVKTAQRIMQRFEQLGDEACALQLTPQDLAQA